MIRKQELFTSFESFSLLCVSFMFNVFSGTLPELSRYCGNSAWLALTLSAIFSFGLFMLYYLLLRMHEGKDLLQITKELFGPLLSKLIFISLFFFIFLYCANNLYEAIHLLALNTYTHSHDIALGLAFLTVVWMIAMYPIKGFARTCSVAIWLCLFSIALILILSYNQYDPHYLTPILGHGPGVITQMGFFQLSNFQGLLLVGIFASSFGGSHNFRRGGLKAVAVANISFICSAFFYAMSGPYQSILYNRAGLLDLAQAIYISRFFQRFESVFIIFVCMGKILILGLGALVLKRLFAELFHAPPRYQKAAVFPSLLGALACCQMMFNLPQISEQISHFMRYTSLYYTLFLLALWLGGTWLRRQAHGGRAALRATSLLLVCCFGTGILSGCSNIIEPDEEIFAIVMGYDKSGPETLRITMKIMPEDKNSAGGSGGGEFPDAEGAQKGEEIPDNVITVDAPCNIPAVDLINTIIPKHLSLLHVKMLVISEELAREDIDMLITPIVRYNEIKSTIAVVVCNGTASDYIASSTTNLIPFLPLETEMILKQSKGTSTYTVRNMGNIYNTYTGNYGDALVMYGGLTKTAQQAKIEMLEQTGETDIPRTKENTLPYIDGLDTKKMSDTIAEQRFGEVPEASPEEEDPGGDSGGTQDSSSQESDAGPSEDATASGEDSPDAEGDLPYNGEILQPSHESWEIGGDPGASYAGDDVPDVFFDDPTLGYLIGYLPGQIPIKTKVEAQIAGMAVLKEKKMVGTLNTHETKVFMLADGSFDGAVVTVRDPYRPDFYVIYYANSRQKNRIKTSIGDDGNAKIDVEVFIHAELAIVQNTEVNYQEPKEKEKLRQYTQEFLDDEIEKLVYKLQKVYEADSLQLGRYVAGNFLTIQEWEEYNWREKYKDADINIKVNLKI